MDISQPCENTDALGRGTPCTFATNFDWYIHAHPQLILGICISFCLCFFCIARRLLLCLFLDGGPTLKHWCFTMPCHGLPLLLFGAPTGGRPSSVPAVYQALVDQWRLLKRSPSVVVGLLSHTWCVNLPPIGWFVQFDLPLGPQRSQHVSS